MTIPADLRDDLLALRQHIVENTFAPSAPMLAALREKKRSE
jgi:hypothetical protein